ncbi:MAG TPA: hypothetical protein PKC45_04915 [Gemmatales bacterium]|nr:hypothetical protein [Gemmatales bacterium]
MMGSIKRQRGGRDARGALGVGWLGLLCLLAWPGGAAAQPALDVGGQGPAIQPRPGRPAVRTVAPQRDQLARHFAFVPVYLPLVRYYLISLPEAGPAASDLDHGVQAHVDAIVQQHVWPVQREASPVALPGLEPTTLAQAKTIWEYGWPRSDVDVDSLRRQLHARQAQAVARTAVAQSVPTGALPAAVDQAHRMGTGPPWFLWAIPLAATPLVGVVALRVGRAMEPYLEKQRQKRRKRRAARVPSPAESRRRRPERRRRSRRSTARSRHRVRFEPRAEPNQEN